MVLCTLPSEVGYIDKTVTAESRYIAAPSLDGHMRTEDFRLGVSLVGEKSNMPMFWGHPVPREK
jgi:hypothetical protein